LALVSTESALPVVTTLRSRATERLPRVLLVLALVAGLAGCGVGLVYNRLDTLMGFYIEGLVNLDREQSEQLARTLSHNLDWHRRSELARYSELLRGLADEMEQRPDPESLVRASKLARDYWRRIFEQAAPGYTRLAASLTDAQVAELLRSFEEEDAEFYDEFLEGTPAERIAKREKRLRRTLERFVGKLTPAQGELLREYAQQPGISIEDWRESRRRWHTELAEALAMRGPSPEFSARMLRIIAWPDDFWTPGYRASVDQGLARFVDLIVRIDATLTPTQRAAAREELLALADEVDGLARG
jgi:rubrerythrin